MSIRYGHGKEIVVIDRGRKIALLTPISRERRATTELVKKGSVKWAGGKPVGLRGIKAKGKPVSRNIKENRR